MFKCRYRILKQSTNRRQTPNIFLSVVLQHLDSTTPLHSLQNLPTMSNSTSNIPAPAEHTSTNNSGSAPSTLEIVLGIFALIFGLMAVTVAILQFRQGRTNLLARKNGASGQPDVEMPNYSSCDYDTDSARTMAYR